MFILVRYFDQATAFSIVSQLLNIFLNLQADLSSLVEGEVFALNINDDVALSVHSLASASPGPLTLFI